MKNQKTVIAVEETDSLMQDSIMRSNSKESIEVNTVQGKEYLPRIDENQLGLTDNSIQKKSIDTINDVLAV